MVDEARIRQWMLDANDGVISTTGIIQGFVGAGADDQTVVFAAMTLMVTGGLTLAGGRFAETSQERAAQLELIEEEKKRLARTPEEEREQLRTHYIERGLDPALADEVSRQLMQRNPLNAQLETEFGMLEGPMSRWQPIGEAFRGFFGFVSGALPLTAIVLFSNDEWRTPLSVLAVIVMLALTGFIESRAGSGTAGRAIMRSVLIGLFITAMAYFAGNVFELLDRVIPQVDIDPDGLAALLPR